MEYIQTDWLKEKSNGIQPLIAALRLSMRIMAKKKKTQDHRQASCNKKCLKSWINAEKELPACQQCFDSTDYKESEFHGNHF